MPSKPVPRENKKTFKGWAKGNRETHVLMPMWPAFCDAAQRGPVPRKKCLEMICERYHFMVPPETSDKCEIEGPFPEWTPKTVYDPFKGLTPEEIVVRRDRMDVLDKVCFRHHARDAWDRDVAC